MKFHTASRAAVAALALAVALTACSSGKTETGDEVSSLTIDKSFDLKTLDPGRQYEPTGSFIAHALYETLLTFDGNDVSKVVPGLASLEQAPDDRTFTLTLEGSPEFSDGTPMTADDVVFSLQRLIGMKGNPSFLLDGVTVTKVDDKTVELTTEVPKPELPAILTNPALGIVNSRVVMENGGTTDTTDSAESFLNETSAGSGPYVLESANISSKIVLEANENYGGTAPTYDRVVIENADGATQAINIEAGSADIALDLSATQAESLDSSINVVSEPGEDVVFLLLNQDEAISTITSNPDFVSAVRNAIDYDELLSLAGPGTVRAGGVIPSMLLGALDPEEAPKTDIDQAKKDLAASGYSGETVTLSFPSDVSLGGVEFTVLAQRIQSQLAEVGINVELAPAPVATELDNYRNGKEAFGLWYFGPSYPDPTYYFAYTPGDLIGLRTGWAADADPTVSELAAVAAQGGSDEERQAAFEELQRQLHVSGPWVPLIQPSKTIAARDGITNVGYNLLWTIDIADLGK
ncbi:ABC transporter substrate-binding protein [Microbacterium sp. RD1]|uniref:ABC transporter substrate-binding protein n=1 Tax=Microbacterium sp. RD1 TaxID=3457313 RepID=UPI003FA5F15D